MRTRLKTSENAFCVESVGDMEIVAEALRSYHETLEMFHNDDDTQPSPAFTAEVRRVHELYEIACARLQAMKAKT